MSETAYARAFAPWSAEDARRALERHWGLSGTDPQRLATERDDTYRITTAQGPVVLKASNPHDPDAVAETPTRVLEALAQAHPDLPVERIIPSATRTSTVRADDRIVRVTTFLVGEGLTDTPRSDAAIVAYGRQLARLHLAVSELDEDPGSSPWNLLAFDDYTAHRATLAPPSAHLIRPIIDRAITQTLPALRALPTVLAHNDFHGENILVDPERPERVVGILDFGDLTRTPRVAELAVAASYTRGYARDAADPWRPAALFVAGYREALAAAGTVALTHTEEELLPHLLRLRLAQRSLLNSALLATTGNPYAARNLDRLDRDLADTATVPPTLEDPR